MIELTIEVKRKIKVKFRLAVSSPRVAVPLLISLSFSRSLRSDAAISKRDAHSDEQVKHGS